ncbi:MAG: transglycosylase SLT domain-containing protein [Saprospiraceae bacterium]
MQKALQNYTLLLASFLTIVVFASYGNKKEDQSTTAIAATTESAKIPQVIRAMDLDKKFSLAGEQVPMENPDVYERMDRELSVNTYWHSTTLLNIKNTYKYFPIIEKILAEEGVPDDFKYLAIAESNLRNATSSAGAKGLWQFMKETAVYYGLEVNSEVDERYHLEKSTHAAAKYIKNYYKQFGSWTLSAAAYNMGGPRLKKEMDVQRGERYYDLNLNDETDRYVFRVIAIKEVIGNPERFGFYLDNDEGYEPMTDFSTVEVDGPIPNLGDFARKNGISYRALKVYNPWLRSTSLTNAAHKTYVLKIPNKKF